MQATPLNYFSRDYFEARERFVRTCEAVDARRHSVPLRAPSPGVQPLTLEFAALGDESAEKLLVVSSGVHGVEAPLGSAVQLALLEQILEGQLTLGNVSLVLIHVLNPYGAAWLRRFNEENIDLNRNFLLQGHEYAGEPPLARVFRKALGPASKPTRYATSLTRMGLLAARHGQRAFWETLPVGQYEYDDWLFYGGKSLSLSGQSLRQVLPSLLEQASEVVHLDFHTGLGRWAKCELLLSEGESTSEIDWWRTHFAHHKVVEPNRPSRYTVRGGFGPWLQALFLERRYHYITAEFGTYSAGRVIRTLAEENRWTRMAPDLHPTHWSRRRLSEAFAPANRKWRTTTHHIGMQLAHDSLAMIEG